MHLAKPFFDQRVAVITGILPALWPSEIQCLARDIRTFIYVAMIHLMLRWPA